MKQSVRKLGILAVTLAAWMSVSLAAQSVWDIDKLHCAPKVFPAEQYKEFQVSGIRSLLYEGVPFRGKPTKVFAYYSTPPGPVPAGGWPAVVLVHGGGGTAYYYYVKIWNSWGYAAISMDLYGKLPRLKDSAMKYVGAPGRPNVEDGWPADKASAAVQNETRHYHAVAQTILAHSLIRSFPEINPEKIGIVGTSWGGVHASIAAAIDGRFKFAAIIYSSVFETVESRMQWWDSGRFVPSIKIPTLWVKGTGDANFSSRNWQHEINICGGGPVSSLVVGLGHGDNGQIYSINCRFADSIIKGAPPLPKVGKIESSGKQVKVAVDSASPILKAELCYTCDVGPDVKQTWKTLPAAVDGKQVSAECRMASHFISSMFMTNQRSPENRNGRPVPSMFQTIAQRFNFKRLFA